MLDIPYRAGRGVLGWTSLRCIFLTEVSLLSHQLRMFVRPVVVLVKAQLSDHVCSESCEIHCRTYGERVLAAAAEATRPPGRVGNVVDPPPTQRDIAARYGIPDRALRDGKIILRSEDDELINRVSTGEVAVDGAVRQIKAARRLISVPAQSALDLRVGDFREVLTDLPDGSVDAIVTDVPWPNGNADTETCVPLWCEMAGFAARVLTPGGLCAALVDSEFLLDLGDALRSHLTYRWQIAYIVPSGYRGHVAAIAHHYPVVVFSHGPMSGGGLRYGSDVIRDNVVEAKTVSLNDKRHEHQKSVEGMAALIERVSDPGALVIDPFCGSGSTGQAALRAGRKFVGCDVNRFW